MFIKHCYQSFLSLLVTCSFFERESFKSVIFLFLLALLSDEGVSVVGVSVVGLYPLTGVLVATDGGIDVGLATSVVVFVTNGAASAGGLVAIVGRIDVGFSNSAGGLVTIGGGTDVGLSPSAGGLVATDGVVDVGLSPSASRLPVKRI
jgi:hypothetical protein